MAWSIFSNGGDSAAVDFGRDLLVLLNAPVNTSTLTFMFQWQRSEGGGGQWSPMNCGPLTRAQCQAWGLPYPVDSLTGEQYGGGAADYANRLDGLHATADYLHMSNYATVLGALRSGDGAAARRALWASPWAASHYGNGANWSNASLPPGSISPPVKPPQQSYGLPAGHVWWVGHGERDVHKNPPPPDATGVWRDGVLLTFDTKDGWHKS